MKDLDAGLQAIVDYLDDCKSDSGHATLDGLVPGVITVVLGDQVTTDSDQPAVTVDWASEDLTATGFGAGAQSRDEIEVCLYLGSLPKGDAPKSKARSIYSSSGGSKGLRHALLSFPAGRGFVLTMLSARYLRREERPDFRFTVGLIIRCAVRQLGAR